MSPKFYAVVCFLFVEFLFFAASPLWAIAVGIRFGKNVLAIAFQLELTPFICMICAKVKLIRIAAQTGVRRGIGFYGTIVKSQVVRKGHGLFSLNRCKSTSKMSHISYVSKLLTLVNTLEPDERLRFKRPNNGHITLREVDKKTARASAGPFRKFV